MGRHITTRLRKFFATSPKNKIMFNLDANALGIEIEIILILISGQIQGRQGDRGTGEGLVCWREAR